MITNNKNIPNNIDLLAEAIYVGVKRARAKRSDLGRIRGWSNEAKHITGVLGELLCHYALNVETDHTIYYGRYGDGGRDGFWDTANIPKVNNHLKSSVELSDSSGAVSKRKVLIKTILNADSLWIPLPSVETSSDDSIIIAIKIDHRLARFIDATIFDLIKHNSSRSKITFKDTTREEGIAFCREYARRTLESYKEYTQEDRSKYFYDSSLWEIQPSPWFILGATNIGQLKEFGKISEKHKKYSNDSKNTCFVAPLEVLKGIDEWKNL